MGTTRRPAWLRGAPARPAGAGGKTVIASWDTSMTTSVSVSLTKWVSLNELEWERGGGDLNADQVKRCYEFPIFFHSLYGVFLSDSWCMPDNSKKVSDRKTRPTAVRYQTLYKCTVTVSIQLPGDKLHHQTTTNRLSSILLLIIWVRSQLFITLTVTFYNSAFNCSLNVCWPTY